MLKTQWIFCSWPEPTMCFSWVKFLAGLSLAVQLEVMHAYTLSDISTTWRLVRRLSRTHPMSARHFAKAAYGRLQGLRWPVSGNGVCLNIHCLTPSLLQKQLWYWQDLYSNFEIMMSLSVFTMYPISQS